MTNRPIKRTADISEEEIKQGYVRNFYGRNAAADFSPIASIFCLNVKRNDAGEPVAVLTFGDNASNKGGITVELKLGESIEIYDKSILSREYDGLSGSEIYQIDPPLEYPVAGTVTLLSIDKGPTVTILVNFNEESEEEFLTANKERFEQNNQDPHDLSQLPK